MSSDRHRIRVAPARPLFLVAACFGIAAGHGTAAGWDSLPHAPGRKFVGVSGSGLTCNICHGKQDQNAAIPGVGGATDDGWVMLNELVVWGTLDKHYQGYTVLLKERSQQMAKILGVVDDSGNSLIHRDVRCLTCHTGMPIDQMQPDAQSGLVPEALVNDKRLNLGVSCESCHGAAGDGDGNAAGWVTRHFDKQNWRFMPPGDKWQNYGFYDVRSTGARTRLCLSCHVGNAGEGRVITHEMYAAGHPPLPGFEMEAFIDQQPPHWRPFGAKKQEVRDEFLAKTNTTFDPAHLHRTQKLLVASLVTLSESLKLSADLADPAATAPVSKPQWPELSQFACYACHHELETPSWRQERGYMLIPGRPTPHEWPFALAQFGAAANGTAAAEFDKQLAPLAAALNQQPFGTPQALPRPARAVAAWADSQAAEIERRQLTRADGLKLLQALANLASQNMYDYDSARQIVWAFNVIYQDLEAGGEMPYTPPAESLGWFAKRDGLDPIESKLAALDDVLLLDLRKGRKTTQTIPGETMPRPLLEVDLELVMNPISTYDPRKFQQRFAEIGQLLERSPTASGGR